MAGVDGSALVHDSYTLAHLLTLRSGFFVVFATLFVALLIALYRHRAQLTACRAEILALIPLTFCMFLPGVDAASFILADLGMLLYAIRVPRGWRAAVLSLGASGVAASAYATSVMMMPLWLCMAAQLAAMGLLGREILVTLKAQGALGVPEAETRV